MDQYLLDNIVRYQTLIQRFKPPAQKATGNDPDNDASIVVTTRIRPLLEDEISSGQVVATFPRGDGSGVIDLHELKRAVRGLPSMNSFAFKPGKIFDADKTTEMIYEETAKPLLPYAWQGNIGTLFAYGQTGSGKTHTVSGMERLIAKSLFDGTLTGERKIHVSIFELAGNSAFGETSCIEDSLGSTQLVDIQEHQVQSTDDLLSLVESANKFRQTASTEKNDGSSRSHAICRIRIENPVPEAVEDGILYLIDLAGSEMARDIFNHAADRMKETREINISLSVLKDCIRGMAELENSGKSSKKPYIPFRQSTLTKVLKHLFDPDRSRGCKTSVLACVNPSFFDTGATKNTLRYAEMLRSSQPTQKATAYNPAIPTTWSNKDLRSYIRIKSGNPSISPLDLAPHESGTQLLRLPVEEFIQRCLKSDGVTEDQADAFHAKLWKLHIDSRRATR
ncbi:P-loop containing nucleoside triphosphate hydrolase protein [Penicillium herquei]|nr:P-loop containing nucleoside triphosphate hydrolase protein [Penicillium herquei]